MVEMMNLGALIVAIWSYIFWEIGFIALKMGLFKAEKKDEYISFIPRLLSTIGGLVTWAFSAALCAPALYMMGILIW